VSMYVLNEAGEPVPAADGLAWARWFETNPDRTVAADDIDVNGARYRVSTVFLGVDHGYGDGDGDPILWETLVFSDDMSIDSTMQRYVSRSEAVIGHAGTVAALERGEVPE